MRPAVAVLCLVAAGMLAAGVACVSDNNSDYGVADGLVGKTPPKASATTTATGPPMDAGVPSEGGKLDAAAEAAPPCKESWSKDIFTMFITTDAGGCSSSTGCHAPSGGMPPIVLDDDAGATYSNMASIQINGKSYLSTGDTNPTDSAMDCQLVLGQCGDVMPPSTSGFSLTAGQKSLIDKWIQCGAPQN